MKHLKPPRFLNDYSLLLEKSRILEKLIPRKITSPGELKRFNPYLLPKKPISASASRSTTDPYALSDLTAINHGVFDLVYDLVDRGGKRWRPILGMTFAECFDRDISGAIERAAAKG